MAAFENHAGVGVLRAQVDEAFGCSDRETRDRHALKQRERVALDQHAVGERSRVALVGVAADVLLLARSVQHGLPLAPGRETRTTASAQTRLRDRLDDVLLRHRDCFAKSDEATVCFVVVEVEWVDDAHARIRQSVLPGQPLDARRQRLTQMVVSAGQQAGVEAARRHRTPALVRTRCGCHRRPPRRRARASSIPRDPLRTIWMSSPRRAASAVSATATSSAPTARAEESRGT